MIEQIIDRLELLIEENIISCGEENSLMCHDRNFGVIQAIECIKKMEKQSKTDWIPFEQREADEEEKAHFLEHYGYELEYMLCGRLPDEDEEILVTYSNGCVGEDIFLRDGKECYLDSGNEFVTEAIAWMPKPQPYRKKVQSNERIYRV